MILTKRRKDIPISLEYPFISLNSVFRVFLIFYSVCPFSSNVKSLTLCLELVRSLQTERLNSSM